MTEARVAELEQRVRCLEAQARRRHWRSRLLGGLLTAALALVSAAYAAKADSGKGPGSIEAREFMIKDPSFGQLLFYVGPEADGIVLFLRDREGRVTARLPAKHEIVPAR